MAIETTEQAATPVKPQPDNGKKTVIIFAKDDPNAPGTTVLGSIDSAGNEGDYEGQQGIPGPPGVPGPPGSLAFEPVADINNPTEIELLTLAGVGTDLLTKQAVGAGGADLFANYIYDANGPAKNAPYVMNTGDGGTTRWVAAISGFTQTGPVAANGSRFITAAEIALLAALTPHTKQKFFSVSNDSQNQDNYGVKSAGSTTPTYFTFHTPHDFVSLVSLQAIFFNASGFVTVDIDLNSSYGALGEDRANHQESNTTTTYSANANEITALDISTVFSVLAAGDFCGLFIDHNAIGATSKYLGILMRYN